MFRLMASTIKLTISTMSIIYVLILSGVISAGPRFYQVDATLRRLTVATVQWITDRVTPATEKDEDLGFMSQRRKR